MLEEDPINLKFKNLVDLKTMEKAVKILLTLRIILHKQSLILESNHYLTHHQSLVDGHKPNIVVTQPLTSRRHSI